MQIKKSKSYAFLWSVLTLLFCIGIMLFYNNNKSKILILEAPSIENVVPFTENKKGFLGLQKIQITVSSKAYNKLKAKRYEAMEAKILLSEDDDLVKAEISHNNKIHNGKIRLKGDWTDHLEGDQWSFRVKLDSDDTLLGMQKFSLHRPATRNGAWEWLFHQLLNDEGVLNLQYHFTQVELAIKSESGIVVVKDLGLYALEEAFSKHLIERNARRESVILKLDENPMWEERADFIARDLNWEELGKIAQSKEENLPIIPFGEKKILQDSNLFQQFITGRALFKSIFTDKNALDHVFDLKLLAKYNAICSLLGANHGMIAHNYRVYYNPVTGLLEPIGFDASPGQKQRVGFEYYSGSKNPLFLAEYANALNEIVKEDHYKKILHYPNLDKVIEILKADDSEYWMDKGVMKFNKAHIEKIIYPKNNLSVFYDKIEDNKIQITIENNGKYPMEIVGIKQTDGRFFTQKSKALLVEGKSRKTVHFDLISGYNQIFTNIKKRKVGFSPNIDIPKSMLVYHTVGLPDKQWETKIYAWSGDKSVLANLPALKKGGNVSNYPYLNVNETEKTITWSSGEWELNTEMIIPAGYLLKVLPNTDIHILSRSARIISYSAFEMIGEENKPINIYSDSKKGQGFLVLNATDTSRIEYCTFNGLANPKTSGWLNTGAINFYESPVKIKNSVIKNNNSEDALNVIRSWVELDNVIFSDTKSDAFDGDFVEGIIKNCLFGDLGNDAIDVSGSNLSVENVKIFKANDKGLSAGENSEIIAKNITIVDCEIAVASKDKSTLKISDSTLTNNKLCFTAFQKKSEFGRANIIAKNIKNENCELEYLIETGSSLLLNGEEVETTEEVKGRMYGVDFGKKS